MGPFFAWLQWYKERNGWYFSVDGGRAGPVWAAYLKLLADDGFLKPTDLVWKWGMADWVPARSIKGLFDPMRAAMAAFDPAI